MGDTEILETMEPEEFARAVKREVVFHVDENCIESWVIRLLYDDGTVKYVRNLVFPDGNMDTPMIQNEDGSVEPA